MNANKVKAAALAGLLQAALAIVSEAAENAAVDAEHVQDGTAASTDEGTANFIVGSLLPLEKAAADLQAIVTAAKAINTAVGS